MLLENCHDGEGGGAGNAPHYDTRGELWCPFHTYRVSPDARPTYGSVLSNLNASLALLDARLSVPGCWAYLDVPSRGLELCSSHSHRPARPAFAPCAGRCSRWA